eukprot:14895790-Alexandrium_andersonii.AAC.1
MPEAQVGRIWGGARRPPFGETPGGVPSLAPPCTPARLRGGVPVCPSAEMGYLTEELAHKGMRRSCVDSLLPSPPQLPLSFSALGQPPFLCQ